MKKLLVLLILVVAACIWYSLQPPRPRRHLAPDGTYFILSYASLQTTTGVVGFTPGEEVHLIDNRPTGKMRVTDGSNVIELDPSQLTDDLDIGASLRQQDQETQRQLAAKIEAQKRAVAEEEEKERQLAAKIEAQKKADAQAAAKTHK